MSRTTLATGCKINLFLRVHDPLPNGYHELTTYFIPLNVPSDRLEIARHSSSLKSSGLTLHCNAPCIDPENNTLSKAYAIYGEKTGFRPSLEVTLHKQVPAGAGLGGGSANAAGLLRYLEQERRREGEPPLAPETSMALAAQIGADVPFFLYNQPALARGIGEALTPMPHPFSSHHVLLVCPAIAISTAWAFAALDAVRKEQPEKTKKDLTYSRDHGTSSFADSVYCENDFEQVVFTAYPELEEIKQELLAYGAHTARLTGTGSTIFGLFTHGTDAELAAKKIKTRGESTRYLTRL